MKDQNDEKGLGTTDVHAAYLFVPIDLSWKRVAPIRRRRDAHDNLSHQNTQQQKHQYWSSRRGRTNLSAYTSALTPASS